MRLEDVRRLVKLVEESDLHALEVSRYLGLDKVIIRKGSPEGDDRKGTGGHCIVVQQAFEPPPARQAVYSPPSPSAPPEGTLYRILSPAVGTFYRLPSPEEAPFVNVGRNVTKGQTVGIVEEMDARIAVLSDRDGIVRRVLVEDSKPVDFNRPLFEIETKG